MSELLDEMLKIDDGAECRHFSRMQIHKLGEAE